MLGIYYSQIDEREPLLFVSLIHLVNSLIIVKLFDLGSGGRSYHIDSEPR